MLLRLTCDEHTLYDVRSGELPPEVRIGRGSKCDWRIPKDQVKASRCHAMLVRSGDKVVIRDWKSRNGILVKGTRVVEKTLAVGDCIDVGGCLLIVAEEPKPPVAKHVPRLIARSGRLKGESFTLGSDTFTIGSDEECSLTITDPMVSRQHAEIRRDSQGAWTITDQGSTNGTMIDGKRLAKGDAYPLRRGTRIFLAQYAFLFDDGKGMPVERRPAVFATLTVVLATALLVGLRVCADRKLLHLPRGGAEPNHTDPVHGSPTNGPGVKAVGALNAVWPPRIREIHAQLADAASRDDAIGREAKSVQHILTQLAAGVERCDEAGVLLGDMRLQELQTLAMTLPPDSDLKLHPALVKCGNTIREHFKTTVTAGALLGELVAAESTMSIDAFLSLWSDDTEIDRVLKWDGSGATGLVATRRAPVNSTDRLLGIEDLQSFYLERQHRRGGSLRPPPSMPSTPFLTTVRTSRALLPAVVTLLRHIDAQPTHAWPGKRFDDKVRQCRRVVALRTRLVEDMTARAAATAGRERLLAAAIGLQLAHRTEDVMVDVDGARRPLESLALDTFDAQPELLIPN